MFLTNRVEDPIRVGEIVVFRIEGREIPIVHRVLKIHEKYECVFYECYFVRLDFSFPFPSVKLEFYYILTDVVKRMGHSREQKVKLLM